MASGPRRAQTPFIAWKLPEPPDVDFVLGDLGRAATNRYHSLSVTPT
jgi:hypothetical protein